MGRTTSPRSPRVYGHRGSPLRKRENTLESFRLALEEGADGVETDVRRLADGRLVLFHDDLVDDRPIASFRVAELRARHDDLTDPSELKTGLPAETELILEVKERGFEAQLAETFADMPAAVICSFDHRVVAELARIRSVNRAAFRVGVTITGRLIGGPAYVCGLGAEVFYPASNFVDHETVSEFREAGIDVVPWVLNLEFEWALAAEWGCHGFITDDPLRAVRWQASSGGRAA